MVWYKDTVSAKKKFLSDWLTYPMEKMANKCSTVWDDYEALTVLLEECMHYIPHGHLLYATDTNGTQISANVHPNHVDNTSRHQDLSRRPYLSGILPYRGLVLSEAYLSQQNGEPCITAIHSVVLKEELLGFIAIDYSIKDLPVENSESIFRQSGWQQFRGDPAIRQQVFHQERVTSVFDENTDFLNYVIATLMQEHGVFHSKMHFSSSRCTLWSLEDPYNYRPHCLEDLMSPDLFFVYTKQDYPKKAVVSKEIIPKILDQFNALRHGDDTIYLRSGSINIMNGLIGLTFSCDGSHYMTVDDFLEKDLRFWFGPTYQVPLPNIA